ncbi:hypothetical protein PUNSTDRAFT_125703 [Punctularia strigosozonata HHB-11173 SS5]|uniref:uncharacterized protein n=1 Tax=Punctularia strigosozonata (strain HHB-11173) TaxID=741275 RepID=UPI00044173B5|nr:uncharacterized protein PUNSTDRAFT_125703 [Punctularia strigosozonata HHB-11173 SS5]EIN09469.1 hypothetical protein PUNSTDRAFT_125703 [Punctularia strigosozonata HHB-11173 SS5]
MLPPTATVFHPRLVAVPPMLPHKPPYLPTIQLDEVPAPPRALKAMTSSAGLSSSSWSSSRSDDFTATDEDDDDDDESDSPCSSYCSSDDECPQDVQMDAAATHPIFTADDDDSFARRMNRIFAWREASAKAMGTIVPSRARSYSPLKRKLSDDDCMDTASDTSSSSKRARSIHSCAACDECFATLESLSMHGRDGRANEACRAAVAYGLAQS